MSILLSPQPFAGDITLFGCGHFNVQIESRLIFPSLNEFQIKNLIFLLPCVDGVSASGRTASI